MIYNLEAGELRRVGACATLEVAKIQVEHALPDGEWRHGYSHIWDYVVERSRMGVPSVDRNPKVLPWPRSWQRAAAHEDSDLPKERLLR